MSSADHLGVGVGSSQVESLEARVRHGGFVDKGNVGDSVMEVD